MGIQVKDPVTSKNETHADVEESYLKFVRMLRAANPKAFFILMANDGADGGIESEVKKAATQWMATVPIVGTA
jgi:hypothetical protein